MGYWGLNPGPLQVCFITEMQRGEDDWCYLQQAQIHHLLAEVQLKDT